jgi:hypothetical protein
MRFRLFAVAAGLVALHAGAASAGVFSDDLAKCLVAKTSPADRTVFIQWMFAAMTANPAVASLSNMTEAQRTTHTQQAGALMQRLLLDDCRKDTVAAIRNEGPEALRQSFGVLGEVAMQNLLNDPAVSKEVSGLAASLDKARWADLAKEIGVAPDTFAPAK